IATFSPDGRWVAYAIREPGKDDIAIYLRSFPEGQKYLVTGNGFRPLWSHDGRELFFARRGQSFIVNVKTTPEFSAGVPTELPIRRYPPPVVLEREYDVTDDGQRFIFALPLDGPLGQRTINVVLNWFDELRKRVPIGSASPS